MKSNQRLIYVGNNAIFTRCEKRSEKRIYEAWFTSIHNFLHFTMIKKEKSLSQRLLSVTNSNPQFQHKSDGYRKKIIHMKFCSFLSIISYTFPWDERDTRVHGQTEMQFVKMCFSGYLTLKGVYPSNTAVYKILDYKTFFYYT